MNKRIVKNEIIKIAMRISIKFMTKVSIIAFVVGSCYGVNAENEKGNTTMPSWTAKTRVTLKQMAANLTATLKPWPVPNRVFIVDHYGAKPDGQTVNTVAIQKAVDACSAKGGGVVRFLKGKYVTGTIIFKSNVMIEVAQGAEILGSTSLKDYPHITPKQKTTMDTLQNLTLSIFYAEGVENIGFRGKGLIDGRGKRFRVVGRQLKDRPFVIRIYDSKNILLEDLHLINSAAWMHQYMNCENLIIQRVKISNKGKRNTDGLDIDGCRRVWIRDCDIESHDDAIALKGNSMKAMEDVLIENCKLATWWNAFKIGTDTQGDFRRIVVRNCTLGGFKKRYSSSGITIASVDGGIVEDFWLYNNTINYANCPFYAVRNLRGRVMKGLPKPDIGVVRRIIVENTTGKENGNGGAISGIPKFPVEDILISNFHIGVNGSATGANALRPFTQIEKNYESNTTYPDAVFLLNTGWSWRNKNLPARGFSLRDCKGIVFNDIIITPKNMDKRPLFHLDKNTEVTGIEAAR